MQLKVEFQNVYQYLMTNFFLEPKELDFLKDPLIMPTKQALMDRLHLLLADVRNVMTEETLTIWNKVAPNCKDNGKISKGENLQGQPYLVLDFPAHLEGDHMLAFRHIIIWGHYAYSQVLISGDYLYELPEQFDIPLQGDFYIQQGGTPWDHFIERPNYRRLQQRLVIPEWKSKGKGSFLKIVEVYPLELLNELPQNAKGFTDHFLAQL